MTKSAIETTKGLCVVAMTRRIMDKLSISSDEAFRKLITMECYRLLMEDDTRLFLETNDFLCKCCENELDGGDEALYRMIA